MARTKTAFFAQLRQKSREMFGGLAEKQYLCAVKTDALVVELVDTPDLGSGAARRVSSSLIRRTDTRGRISVFAKSA